MERGEKKAWALRRWACLAAAALLGAACEEQEPTSIEGFELEMPRSTYDDTTSPRADLPQGATISLAAQTRPPLAVVGEDDGDESIFYAAVLGGYYLMKVQREDGSFEYQYDIEEGAPDADAEDSIHRQAGSTYTQAYLATATRRVEFGISTAWALDWMTGQMETLDDGTMQLVDFGATALVLLSLTEHGQLWQDRSRDRFIHGAGEHLLARLGEDGRFTAGSGLQYGQASQALWKLYAYTQDERYLDGLERALFYLYEHPELAKEPEEGYLMGLWINEPLTELYQLRPADWIPAYAFRLADEIVAHQYTADNTGKESWVGSYICPEVDNEPTWRTALRLEAVIDALRLAQLVGDEERVEIYRDSSLLAAHYLRGIQLRKGDTRDAVDPALAIGGVPFSRDSDLLRVDITHHTANALVKVTRYLEIDEFVGR